MISPSGCAPPWRKPRRSSRNTAAACPLSSAKRTRSRYPASAAGNRASVKSGLEDAIASGVVITGGSSILEGMPELAEQIFNLPVRRGVPQKIGGLVDVVNSPVYATGVGLVVYGSRNSGSREHFPPGKSDDSIFNTTMRRMKTWFREFF